MNRLALGLPLLLVASLAQGGSAQFMSETVVLSHGEWYAARFNLSGSSDLELTVHLWKCNELDDESPHSFIGSFFYVIDNGDAQLVQAAYGSVVWSPGEDFFAVGAAGTTVRPAVLPAEGGCGGSSRTVWAWPEDTSLTIVGHTGAGTTEAWTEASWTRGVTSFDITHGPGVLKTKAEFQQGVYAAVYPIPSAGAGGLLRDEHVTTRDVIGFFRPSSAENPLASCSRNGIPCESDDERWDLAGKGLSSWEFEIAADATVGEEPHYVLGLIPLPGDDYLSAN